MRFQLGTFGVMALTACNPIPIKQECAFAKLQPSIEYEVEKHTDSWGVFSGYCATHEPERIVLKPDTNHQVTLNVRGDWIDIKASKDGVPISLSGPQLREVTFQSFTNSVRYDSLSDHRIEILLEGAVEVIVPFQIIQCTCVRYDAI